MPLPTHKHTPQRRELLHEMTDDCNARAAFKSREVTEEVLMRVLSVYPVRPCSQTMNNRHCGSILWILNQWHWEMAFANTWRSGKGAVSSGVVIKKLKKRFLHLYLWAEKAMYAIHFLAGVFFSLRMTNRLFVQRPSCEAALLACGVYQWLPWYEIELKVKKDKWILTFSISWWRIQSLI